MEKDAILELFRFYREAPTSLQRLIVQHTERATLPVGTEYFREGELCSRIALVGEGRVRVFKASSGGRQITLYHVGPGESCILTASCVLTGLRYPANAVVEGDRPLEALVIPADVFRDWVASHDAVRNFVFQLMSDRLMALMLLVEEVAFGKMERRLAAFLRRRLDREGAGSNLAITHDQIAAELGTAREVVSRILKEFERQGIVEVGRGKVNILNTNKLKSIEESEYD